jgi:hypothetical protein
LMTLVVVYVRPVFAKKRPSDGAPPSGPAPEEKK